MPEIVEEGVTGRLVDGATAAAAVVDDVTALDRAACRRAALERFSADRMVDDYLDVYARVLA